jgi:hypothetical protein
MILLIKMIEEIEFIINDDDSLEENINQNDDENIENDLASYLYVNNGYCFEYFVGYEIAALLGS